MSLSKRIENRTNFIYTLIVRGLGEGNLTTVSVLVDGALHLDESAIEAGYWLESADPGLYAWVHQSGAWSKPASARFARRVCGLDGRLGAQQVVVRERGAAGNGSEAEWEAVDTYEFVTDVVEVATDPAVPVRPTITIRGSDQWKTTTHRHPDGSFTRTTTKTTKKPRNKKTVFKKGGRHKSAAVQNRETMRSAKRINDALDLDFGSSIVWTVILLFVWMILEIFT